MAGTILISTDTWEPQVNGVVRQLKKTIGVLLDWGYRVEVIHPYLFKRFRVPFFKDIEFTTGLNRWRINRMVRTIGPSAIHVATEGPLGLAVSRYCKGNQVPFSTWHHTDFPETLPKVFGLSTRAINGYLKWFHKHSSLLMVYTERMRRKLVAGGFTTPMRVWSGGVDTNQFQPRPKRPHRRKIALYVGRISSEKGLDNFLDCHGDYDKVLVGDGAARHELETRYPDARFLGLRSGEELAAIYADADVFVFPSKTDTFGLVMVEALACGIPVAAYPVQGPVDIVDREGVGCLSENLEYAIEQALASSDPQQCRDLALKYSWESSARQFLSNLVFQAD